jgi:hypothetical protein
MAEKLGGDPQEPVGIRVRDDGTAPILLVDGIHGMNLQEGLVTLNLTRMVVPTPGASEGAEPYVQTVARLALTPATFSRIAAFLHEQYRSLEAQGVVPTATKIGEEDVGG